jgi:hypothetical protein
MSHRTNYGIAPSNGASASMPVVPVRGAGGSKRGDTICEFPRRHAVYVRFGCTDCVCALWLC